MQDQMLAQADAWPHTRALLLDPECTDHLEITSSDMLDMLLDRLHERRIDLYTSFAIRENLRITLDCDVALSRHASLRDIWPLLSGQFGSRQSESVVGRQASDY